jgi:tetratricopeptide (TPR) repeat protein
MDMRRALRLALALATCLPLFWAAPATRADDPGPARRLAQAGKYEEALEALDTAAKALKPDDANGRARLALQRAEVLAATGRRDQATAALEPFEKDEPARPDVLARLAALDFDRGQWDAAQARVDRALKADPDHLGARSQAARIKEARGERPIDDWRWFVDRFNLRRGELEKDADALVLIGQAAEKYYWARATGDELAEGLNDVLNDLYEAAIQLDPTCWQAAWLQGRLFLAGYREPPARKELNRAVLLNPSAAEVIVDLGRLDLEGYKLADGRRRAQDALEINPELASALVLKADCDISDERFDDALKAARQAVALNPRDEAALARLAAASRLKVDPVGAAAAESQALAVNPRPAVFFAALGERLADRRKYLPAERAFLQALEADPGHVPARIGLAMLYMQVGREREARDLFQAAIEAWPFEDNVRTVNMIKVLEHLAAYKTIETEHFSVAVLPGDDEVVARAMAKFLEESLPDLGRRFGFTPPGRTRIELMKDHQWFSGRTTGLPFIPTVGACTGKIVALASPTSTKKPFNWSRVLVHEVTHVITLQQTEFNIPHWFTEALAVESEQSPRPQPWNKMLLERVPTRKKLHTLDSINLGFIRPEEPDDRQMAYCQAQLYAQYMTKRFGDDAIPKFLAAYRRGLTTEQAIDACFGVTKADFEAKYLDHLDAVVKTISARVESEEPITFSALQRQLAEKPDDADLNARMAYEHFARRDLKAARPFADKALKLREHHPLASYVKARLFLAIGDDAAALELLEPALDPDAPNERVVDLAAELLMKDGRLDQAEALYRKAHEGDPYLSKWLAGLARVHLRQGRRDLLLEDLARLADNDPDDLDVRQTLADEWFTRKDYDQAARWATECLYIQTREPSFHVLLGDARSAQKKPAEAIDAYATALELKPKKDAPIRLKLARAQKDAGRNDDAKATLDALLKSNPDNEDARALRDEIDRAG